MAFLYTQNTIIWTALLPIFFNKLIKDLYYTKDQDYHRKYRGVFYITICTLILISFCSHTSLNVETISQTQWGVAFDPGMLYHVLFFHLVVGFGFGFYGLIKIYTNPLHIFRKQAFFIFLGACLTVSISIIFDIILPILGNTYLTLYAPLTTIIFVFSMSLAIKRYNLFNIKILTIEMVVFLLWISILVKVLLNYSNDNQFWGLGLWGLSVIFGTLLIRNIFHIISLHEKIEKLTGELSGAYSKIREMDEKD